MEGTTASGTSSSTADPSFVRLRLGVGHPGDKNLVTDYVLKRGSADVERAIEENISEAVKIMPLLIDEGLNAATKALHTKE